jgi:hypothetical protein
MHDVNVTDLVGHLDAVVDRARGLVRDLETGLRATVRVCDERHAAHAELAALEEAHRALRGAHDTLLREHEASLAALAALRRDHRSATEALAALQETCDTLVRERLRAADELGAVLDRLRRVPPDVTPGA